MSTIRLADLIGSSVVDAEGNRIGHVVDLVVDRERDFALREIVVGSGGWIGRLNMQRALPKRFGHRAKPGIAWSDVDRIERQTIHLKVVDPRE